jgi:hypothetical protein
MLAKVKNKNISMRHAALRLFSHKISYIAQLFFSAEMYKWAPPVL